MNKDKSKRAEIKEPKRRPMSGMEAQAYIKYNANIIPKEIACKMRSAKDVLAEQRGEKQCP